MDVQIKELTLLLLYLTSWKENDGSEFHRSWKGYPFEVLNELTEKGYIGGSFHSKSVYFTNEGVQEAMQLVEKYLEKQ